MSLDDRARIHGVLPEVPVGARIRFSLLGTDLSQPQQYLPDALGNEYLSIPGARKNELSVNPGKFQGVRVMTCDKATLEEILDLNLKLRKKVRFYVYPSNERDGMFDVYTHLASPQAIELISHESLRLANKTELTALGLLQKTDES